MGLYLQPRQGLSDILHKIPGVNGVYYQAPASVEMKYPCIRYELSGIPIRRGDNIPYLGCKRYTCTVIDENPDSTIPDAMFNIPYCTFDLVYVADGLNHFVFTVYF